ncbi:MAG: transcriptional repressor [Chlorobiaceae bacterium]|nr:transcriptional repressor [Chlorobiaceae bacterium]NTW74103.1 transcriptional repressor [Chlorobiaceae bacterium]
MQELYQRLRESGLKLTPRRKAIIDLFAGHEGRLSPREVQSLLSTTVDRCGLPGVYRNLEALADCGVLFRVAGFGRERSYAFCAHGDHADEHHHHIVCVSCGRSAVVEECGYRAGMMIGGFRLVDHVVQLQGLCDGCMNSSRRNS